MSVTGRTPGVDYTEIDLNATETTGVYDPSRASTVWGVYLANGDTAVFDLEITDGTTTSTIDSAAAGSNLSFTGPIEVASSQSLQITVSTAEGTALTDDCAVIRSEE